MQVKLNRRFQLTLALIASLAVSSPAALAQQDAEALVASKRPADMSYRDLMQMLGRSLTWLQDGIILENKQLVREGVKVIVNHPAPRHKPWTIMDAVDQDGFKKSLMTYDKVLDAKADSVAAATEKNDWLQASASLAELRAACISCHAQWRHKARR
ncbi:MAG: hypothetical protein Q8O25_17385 [Sulfurisoma sp.]|nr:hypothetical protein [Sulfurisoma sp.]